MCKFKVYSMLFLIYLYCNAIAIVVMSTSIMLHNYQFFVGWSKELGTSDRYSTSDLEKTSEDICLF